MKTYMVKFKDGKDIAKLLLNLKKKNYSCNIKGCKYIATTPLYYKLHLMKHNNIYLFKCKLCYYKTVRKFDFKRHNKVHYIGHKKSCKYCSYKTKHPEYLKNHVKKKHKSI